MLRLILLRRFSAPRLGWLAVVLLSAAPALCSAQQDDVRSVSGDELFPGAGRGLLSVATGVPFLTMAEASVGVTQNLALGALAGFTPRVKAFGGRPRLRLVARERVNVSLVM